MKIGVQELIIVFIVALIVIGPDKLPAYARKLGEALRQFKKYSSEATKEIRESVVEPLEEAQRPLKEAMEPITDLEKTVRKDMNDLKKSINGIGKPDSASAKAADTDTQKQQGASDTSAEDVNTSDDGSGNAENAPANRDSGSDESADMAADADHSAADET